MQIGIKAFLYKAYRPDTKNYQIKKKNDGLRNNQIKLEEFLFLYCSNMLKKTTKPMVHEVHKIDWKLYN